MVFHFWKVLFSIIQHPEYISKDFSDKTEYLSLWTANTHHFIIVFVVLHFLKNSECQGAYDFIFLHDPVCVYTADYGCVRAVMITCGYLSYDFIIYKFLIEDRGNPLYKQTLAHHIIGTIGLISAVLTGFSFTGIGNIALLCEISTFFLNYRAMYTKENLG